MIADSLRSHLPGVPIESISTADGQETIVVPADRIVDICRDLRHGIEPAFVLLADITAVDYWPREPRFEVVYHVAAAAARLRL